MENASDHVVLTADMGPAYRRLQGYKVLWMMNGNGIYQIDFKNYNHSGERILFLGPGQYFNVVAGSFTLKEIEVPEALLTKDPQLAASSRFLFTHVYEVGSIAPSLELHRSTQLTEPNHLQSWLWQAARYWHEQKPLHPKITPKATNLIFDLRQLIESYFREQRPIGEYVDALNRSSKWVNRITTSYINRTIGQLVRSRQLLEAKRELFFSDKTVKEIAYELDYTDPAYFSRSFAREVGMAPAEFRASYASKETDPFLARVWTLVNQYYRQTRAVAFYAEQMFMTPKALSAKVKRRTGLPLTHLIKNRVVAAARELLIHTDLPVQAIARHLGFDEAPHFSHFFKQATGHAPSQYRRS